jgi:hypothetical protein
VGRTPCLQEGFVLRGGCSNDGVKTRKFG